MLPHNVINRGRMKMINTKALGNRIRELRIRQSLSQQDLANLMFTSRFTVLRWESGEHLPDITVLSRLAEVLKVETYELLDILNSTAAAPNVIVVDDESIILRGFVRMIEEVLPEANVRGFRNTREALAYAADNQVSIAFLDIEIPGESGITIGRQLMDLNPRINIIFLTGHPEYALDAINMYSSGYILKPLTPDKIRKEIAHLRFPVNTLRQNTGGQKNNEKA